jgi:hypothetical protein
MRRVASSSRLLLLPLLFAFVVRAHNHSQVYAELVPILLLQHRLHEEPLDLLHTPEQQQSHRRGDASAHTVLQGHNCTAVSMGGQLTLLSRC